MEAVSSIERVIFIVHFDKYWEKGIDRHLTVQSVGERNGDPLSKSARKGAFFVGNLTLSRENSDVSIKLVLIFI